MKQQIPKRKIVKLTPEQKKLVWAVPKENAGAGWTSKRPNPRDPHEAIGEPGRRG